MLVDFVVTILDSIEATPPSLSSHQTLFFDKTYINSSTLEGILIISPHHDILKYKLHLKFLATNKIIEYETLVVGLNLVIYCEA